MKEVPGLAHPPVEVVAAAFRDAVDKVPKMRRPPLGTKGFVPTDTVLSPHESGMMIETPVMGTLVPTSAPWLVVVSVDARRLVDLCKRLAKIGAFKERNATLWISVGDGELRVKSGSSTAGIPHWPSPRQVGTRE